MDQDNTTWTVARTPGVIRETVCTVVHQRTASLDSERGTDEGSEVHAGRRQTVRRELNSQSTGRPRLKYRPSSRTGENPLSGMIGGTMETAASFEARFAPSSYPTLAQGCSTGMAQEPKRAPHLLSHQEDCLWNGSRGTCNQGRLEEARMDAGAVLPYTRVMRSFSRLIA